MTPGQAAVAERVDYAELALKNGDAATALAGLAEVLESVEVDPTSPLGLRSRQLQASAWEVVGDYPAAIGALDTLAAEMPRDLQWIGVLMALSRCHRDAGDLARAIRVGEDTETEIRQVGLADSEEAIRLSLTVAAAFNERGDVRYAIRMCQRAAELADEIGSSLGRASAQWNESLFRSLLGEVAEAVALAQQAVAVYEAVGDPRRTGMLHHTMCGLYMRLDPPDLSSAEHHVVEALRLMEWSDASAVEKAQARWRGAYIVFCQGDLDEARRTADACLAVGEEAAAPSLAAGSLILLGQIALAEGLRTEARQFFGRAVLFLSSHGLDREIAQFWFQLGALLYECGDHSGAIDAYRRSAVSAGVLTPHPFAGGL